jgi:hypothetical protein
MFRTREDYEAWATSRMREVTEAQTRSASQRAREDVEFAVRQMLMADQRQRPDFWSSFTFNNDDLADLITNFLIIRRD